jgi:uncharacterized metal-binding protein YceD (DUF177 family)
VKKIINPTGVSLQELQPEGRDFFYTNLTGELTEGLKDIINNNPYSVSIHLRPLGNAFEITGKIETSMNLTCSRCGRDASLPIHDDFRELILVEVDRPRGSQSGHVGAHLTGDGPYCNYVSSDYFDLVNFVHEHVAASEPYIVECGKKDCEEAMHKAQLGSQAPASFDENTNPFAALKNVKLR